MDEINDFGDKFLYLGVDSDDMATKEQKKNLLIIFVFAVLHGLCCLCCRKLGIDDARALTLLTIAMVFILAYFRRMKFYYIVAAVIIMVVLAYLVGSAIPLLLVPLLGQTVWINVISTTFTTLVLGLMLELGTDVILRLFGGEGTLKEVPAEVRTFRQRWIVRINDRIVPVETGQIAYFFSEDKSNYLVTFDGGKYLVDSTIDGIFAELDPGKFFRIGRGCVLSRTCIDCAVVNSGRYTVEVHPNPDGLQLVVTRSRVDEFLKWLQ